MTGTLFTNARLIDPDAGTDTIGALRVSGGRIAEILSGPADATGEISSEAVFSQESLNFWVPKQ